MTALPADGIGAITQDALSKINLILLKEGGVLQNKKGYTVTLVARSSDSGSIPLPFAVRIANAQHVTYLYTGQG